MKTFDGIIRVKIQLAKPIVKKTIAWATIAGLVLSLFAFVAPGANVQADSNSINFETPAYTTGNINGQDGWSATGSASTGCAVYDEGVDSSLGTSGFGTQSFRISDAVTSGCFGDQAFAKPLTDSVGETSATAGTFSAGTKQPHFETQFDIASTVPDAQQTGMHMSFSPDRGDGSRMSYLRFEDQADGIHVFFDDVTDPGPIGTVATFNETDIATISRTVHTIKLTMDVVDGPGNDVVKVYIDGVLKATGTSWEDYYRFDPEASAEQSPRIVKTDEFRESGDATPTDAGKGFLIDNLSLLSGPTLTVDQTCADHTLASSTATQFKGLTTTDPAGSSATGLFSTGTPGSAVVATPTGFPGAWDAAAANPNVTGANWVNNEVIQPTNPAGPNPGEDGTIDTWRLFTDSITIPADATSISSPVLHFTSDNSVQAFLDNTSVGSASDYTTVADTSPLTISTGTHEFEFVVKNDAYDGSNNPTGLLYKVTVNYCEPNTPPPTQGHIVVKKVTSPSGDPTNFGFTTIGTGYNPFSLTDGTQNDQTLDPGTYTVAETATTGWTLNGGHPDCIYDDQATGQPVVTNGEQVTLAAGDTVTCTFTNTKTISPQVHIFKYVDGAQATATNTNSTTFPMETTFNSPNLGVATNVPFTLSPTGWGATDSAYEASFVGSDAGADYEADEVLGGAVVGLSCDGTHTFALIGYTFGETLADAQAGTPSLIAPSFTNLQTDKYVIVWNKTCPTTGSLTVTKDTLNTGDTTFNFTGSGSIGAFTITTVGGIGTKTFTGLIPGNYTINEAAKSGWTMTDTECSPVNVTTNDAGTFCTITNTKNPKLGEIRGTKYEDRDGDGKLTDGDHHRLAGWTIYLDTNNNGNLDSGEPSTVTDSHGNYHFSGLVAGTYHVREVNQSGWVQTVPSSGKYDITLGAGKVSKKNNFGNFKLGSIAGIKFYDQNGNKHKDNSEAVLSGWTIQLRRVGNPSVIATAVTDVNGQYTFSNIGPGTYQVREVQQLTWVQSTNNPSNIWMHSGLNLTHIDFGNKHPGDGNQGHDHENDNHH